MCNTTRLNEYCIVLKGDSAPYFWVYANDYEITRHSLTHEPYMVLFGVGSDMVCSVRYSDIDKIEQLIYGKLVKLNI